MPCVCFMKGHSMAVLGSNLQKLEVSNLLTPEYSSSTGSCLQFWYACVDIILYWSIMDPVFVFKLCSNPVESNVNKGCFCRYWLSAGSGGSLSVHVLLNGEMGPALWSLSGATSDSWEVAEFTVSSPSKFRVSSLKDYRYRKTVHSYYY